MRRQSSTSAMLRESAASLGHGKREPHWRHSKGRRVENSCFVSTVRKYQHALANPRFQTLTALPMSCDQSRASKASTSASVASAVVLSPCRRQSATPRYNIVYFSRVPP